MVSANKRTFNFHDDIKMNYTKKFKVSQFIKHYKKGAPQSSQMKESKLPDYVSDLIWIIDIFIRLSTEV